MTAYYKTHNAKIKKVDLDELGEMYYFIADDTYEASIITSFSYIESKLPKNDHEWVVFVPARNVVFIVSTEFPLALYSVSSYAEKIYNEYPYKISPYGYVKVDNKWIRREINL